MILSKSGTYIPEDYQVLDENKIRNDKAYGYVYETINLINGKRYIGQHSRKYFDKKYYGSGKYIKAAIEKYGKENFDVIILGWCYSKEDLDFGENYFIESCDTLVPNGYNLMTGHSHGKHNKETKEILSNITKERLKDKTNHPRFGSVLSESQIIKIKNSLSKTYENKVRNLPFNEKLKLTERMSKYLTQEEQEKIKQIKKNESQIKKNESKKKMSENSKKRNHIYWHERRNIINKNCKYCMKSPEDTR